MANEENLISFAERTESEQREISKKAGIASGKARRKKKEMREELIAILEEKIADKQTGKKTKLQRAILLAQVKEALKGKTKAAEFIRDTIGEKPTDKQEITGNLEVQKIFVSPEMHKETLEHIKSVINDT